MNAAPEGWTSIMRARRRRRAASPKPRMISQSDDHPGRPRRLVADRSRSGRAGTRGPRTLAADRRRAEARSVGSHRPAVGGSAQPLTALRHRRRHGDRSCASTGPRRSERTRRGRAGGSTSHRQLGIGSIGVRIAHRHVSIPPVNVRDRQRHALGRTDDPDATTTRTSCPALNRHRLCVAARRGSCGTRRR